MGLSLNIGMGLASFIMCLVHHAIKFQILGFRLIFLLVLLVLLIVNFFLSDMSSTAFIEPLPVIEFVAQILGKDVLSRPLSDANRIKVIFYLTN